MDWRWFILLLLFALGLTIFLGLMFPAASAYYMVQQGDNITQGETYDLSGIYSWGDYQGQFAYWKHWYNEGTNVEPTKVIFVEPRNRYNVYIDPSQWTVGNWYKRCSDCKNENNFAFKVIASNDAIVRAQPTTVAPGQTMVAVTGRITQTQTTSTPTETPTPVPAQTDTPVVIVLTTQPTPVPTPSFPKPGLPLSPFPIMFGILGAALLFGKSRGLY